MAGSKLKSMLATLSYRAGFFSLLEKVRLRESAIILMYHRVVSPAWGEGGVPVQPGMYVTPETFAHQVEWIQSYFSVLSLQELLLRLRLNKDVSKCCVLTFDDGWVDNYQNVFPIIQKHRVPCTVFLATGLIGTNRWFWPDEVAECLFLICRGKVNINTFSDALKKLLFQSGVGGKNELQVVIDDCIELIKVYSPKQRKALMLEMTSVCFGGDMPNNRYLMNWDEVKEMADSGLVEFGSHTANHRLLNQISPKEVLAEIVDSKNKIENEIGQPCLSFAYPNGNYSNEVISVLQDSGIMAAVTTSRGYVTAANTSTLFELPRIAVHDDVSCSCSLFWWRLLVQ